MPDPIAILVPQEIANDDSVRVVSLAIAHGQRVLAGARVAEIETSKSTVEITTPADGWAELCCKAGDDIAIGGLLARLHASELRAPAEHAAITAAAGSTAQHTVFSEAARKEIAARGLDPAAFAGRGFVRERDVTGATTAVPVAEPAAATPSAPQPFQQTFCEDWPWHRLIKADLFRINGADDARELLANWWTNPAFVYVMWFRIAQAARRHPLARLLIYPFARWRLGRCHYRTGIRIPLSVKAGPGLLIGHWGAVWISPECSFGANCSLGNGINIGGAGGSGKRGVPQLGDNVFIGPGAKLSEPITIGHEAAVMANTVVAADVPPGAIALGVPHRIAGRQERNRYVSNRCEFTPSPPRP